MRGKSAAGSLAASSPVTSEGLWVSPDSVSPVIFTKPPKRQQADLVVRLTVLEAEQARAKTERERLDAHSAKLGHNEVSQLVHNDHHADEDDKGCGRYQKCMHRCWVLTSAKRLPRPAPG